MIFFFSSRRRHTRLCQVTGVQTCALPISRTENAQPGIFLVSWVAFQLLRERVPALKFDATAGFSLGDFTELTAADAMSFAVGLGVVCRRGRFMQEACDMTSGCIAAVIGLDEAPTREVCA